MRNLADAAGWPPQMKNKIAGMGDDPETIATEVLQLAISWLRFESQSERAGDTYLGTLLQALLPQVGDPQTKIATLILRYNLVKRPTAVSEVKKYLA
jgi:hypothetical protein